MADIITSNVPAFITSPPSTIHYFFELYAPFLLNSFLYFLFLLY
nr:MAG TPA: hypothetical protein [Caudoviricetes sp.]